MLPCLKSAKKKTGATQGNQKMKNGYLSINSWISIFLILDIF